MNSKNLWRTLFVKTQGLSLCGGTWPSSRGMFPKGLQRFGLCWRHHHDLHLLRLLRPVQRPGLPLPNEDRIWDRCPLDLCLPTIGYFWGGLNGHKKSKYTPSPSPLVHRLGLSTAHPPGRKRSSGRWCSLFNALLANFFFCLSTDHPLSEAVFYRSVDKGVGG